MLVFHAIVPIDPERREEAIERASEMAAVSRARDVVIDYRVAVDVDDPNVLRFFEQFPDEASFEAHLDTDHYRAFMDDLSEFLASEPEIRRFEVETVEEIDL